jgi:hypothetical protein
MAFDGTFSASDDASVPIPSHFEHEIEAVFDYRNNDGCFRWQPHVPAVPFLAVKCGGGL